MPTEPLYSLIASQAEALVTSGRWQEGDRLPPERELCKDFGVSRATLRQALGRAGGARPHHPAPGTGHLHLQAASAAAHRGRLLHPRRHGGARPEDDHEGAARGDRRSQPAAGRRPGLPAGRRGHLHRAPAPRRRRAHGARHGPPAGRAVPGPRQGSTSSSARSTTCSSPTTAASWPRPRRRSSR